MASVSAWLRGLALACLSAQPALAQITVLDEAQDDAAAEAAAPLADAPVATASCGTQPLTIARMGWPSAELLAEIHTRLVLQQFGCTLQITPGDLTASVTSMGSTGQPAVIPEMWATRVPELWNAGIEAQMLRPAAPTYVEPSFEGWFVPDFVAEAHPELTTAAGLAEILPTLNEGERVRFISCPPDWACAIINRNLIAAHGIADQVEIVEPATRFEMDTLIAQAISGQDPVLFYYWQPNGIIAQFGFVPLDMGLYSEEAFACLAETICSGPQPSAFPSEVVVVAVAEWVFAELPSIAGYFGRAVLPLTEMNALLTQLTEPGATAAAVAERFVTDRQDLWGEWVGLVAP